MDCPVSKGDLSDDSTEAAGLCRSLSDNFVGLETHDLGQCCIQNLDLKAGLLTHPVLIFPGRLGYSTNPPSESASRIRATVI